MVEFRGSGGERREGADLNTCTVADKPTNPRRLGPVAVQRRQSERDLGPHSVPGN